MAMMCGCANEEPNQESSSGCSTIKVTLNVDRVPFSDEPASRVSSSFQWKDGDILYLRFFNGSQSFGVRATYKAFTWIIPDGTYVPKVDNGTVKVCFLGHDVVDNPSSKIALTPYEAVYMDDNGSFSFNDKEELVINATLKPQTGRICFKGEDGLTIHVGNISYLKSFDFASFEFTYEPADQYDWTRVPVQTANDGETPYVYGLNSCGIIRVSYDENGDYATYVHTLTDSQFQIGQSGWMKIPDKISHSNWTRKELSGIHQGHKWLNLGDRDEVKWSIENIGANYDRWMQTHDEKDIYGNWYSWGSTDPNNFHYVNTSDHVDVASYEWGEGWWVAAAETFDDLYRACTYEWVLNYLNSNIAGALLKSKKYGNEIFFPAAGWYNCGDGFHEYEGTEASYFTYLYDVDANDSYVGRCDMREGSFRTYCNTYREHKKSVRPVKYF